MNVAPIAQPDTLRGRGQDPHAGHFFVPPTVECGRRGRPKVGRRGGGLVFVSTAEGGGDAADRRSGAEGAAWELGS
jgi:hypothetical protein